MVVDGSEMGDTAVGCGKDCVMVDLEAHASIETHHVRSVVLGAAQVDGAPPRDAEVDGAPSRDAEVDGAPSRDAEFDGVHSRDAEVDGAPSRGVEVDGVAACVQVYGVCLP